MGDKMLSGHPVARATARRKDDREPDHLAGGHSELSVVAAQDRGGCRFECFDSFEYFAYAVGQGG